MPGEIEFKGELHTIPAGAALVLQVDHILSEQQVDHIQRYVARVLGSQQRVLVLGSDITPIALTDDQAEAVTRKLDLVQGGGSGG